MSYTKLKLISEYSRFVLGLGHINLLTFVPGLEVYASLDV